MTTYNLLNYLLPGILFVIFANHFTSYSFLQENLIIGGFLYYFIGMVISRIGSLFIEPFLKKIRFLNFSNYKDFIYAGNKDEKIGVLSEQNNQYRTIVAFLVSIGLLKVWELFSDYLNLSQFAEAVIIYVVLLIIFLVSYRKQTNYIRSRVEANKKEGGS